MGTPTKLPTKSPITQPSINPSLVENHIQSVRKINQIRDRILMYFLQTMKAISIAPVSTSPELGLSLYFSSF